jgi:hypothetical protein
MSIEICNHRKLEERVLYKVVFKRSSDNAESKQIDAHNSVLWTVANHVVLDIIRADAACDNFHCGEKYLEASDGILPFGTVVTKSRDKKVRCMYRVPKLSLANSEQSPPTFGKFALENAAGSSWRAMREIFAVYTGRTVVLC